MEVSVSGGVGRYAATEDGIAALLDLQIQGSRYADIPVFTENEFELPVAGAPMTEAQLAAIESSFPGQLERFVFEGYLKRLN